ncbi:MAG: hypothetical protein ACEPOZ_07100 [Marinifilaceae bacterium]
MEGMNTIDNSLTETIINFDLQNISANLAEIILDSMLDNGVLKDLPIVSSIVGLSKTALNIKDSIFLK